MAPILLVVGTVALVVGVGLVSIPAAVITVGLLLILIAIAVATIQERRKAIAK